MRLIFLLIFAGCSLGIPKDTVDTGSDTAADTDTDDTDVVDTDTVPVETYEWCFDGDRDGHGSDNCPVVAATQPGDYYVANSDDCDDANAAVHPGANENEENGIDDDCDGEIDEVPYVTRWMDDDLDGFGNPDRPVSVLQTDTTVYIVSNDDDCDDDDAAITTGEYFFADADADGFGDSGSVSGPSCTAPTGYVDNATDCDDSDGDINPDAEPQCAVGVDADCDGSDDSVDADRDGFAACEECADANAAINPDADEVCDGQDNDCDGRVDDNDTDVTGATTWYDDDDADGYGDVLDTFAACDQPAGTATAGDDCDDLEEAVNPGARELCDSLDNDCDGLVDDADSDIEGQTTWYWDVDADGFGSNAYTELACYVPAVSYGRYVEDGGDCDEGDDDINPGVVEIVDDAIDNDCDGLVDES